MKKYYVSCEIIYGGTSFAFPLHFVVSAKDYKNARKIANYKVGYLNFACPFDDIDFKVFDIYEIL